MARSQVRWMLAACIATALLMSAFPHAGANSDLPADKVAAAGSAVEVMNAPAVEGATSDTVTLLTGRMRTSSPEDLIFNVTLECALLTDVTNVGNSDSSAVAEVKIWVTIDGVPIPVSGDDSGPDAGKVVFCNRAYREVITSLDDSDARFDHYLHTRAANSFNWLTLNVGSGVHDLAVLGALTSEVTGTGMAQAIVGKRTLIVEPTKLANSAVI